MTPKKRAELKKIAHNMKPSIIIGKGGINEHTIKQINEMLDKHELVKGKCLDTSPTDVSETINLLMDETNSEFVQKIGSIFVIYKEKKE